jgi:hypothetical protein
MFPQIVSSLSFSPALVRQLGFYAKRLKKEEVTRRLGLIFTILALVIQSLAVFSPPESANASSSSDLISGGIKDKAQLMSIYDQSASGHGDYKNILDYSSITRLELNNVQLTTINSLDFSKSAGPWLSWGRLHRFSGAEGEVAHNIPVGGNFTTIYSRPLWRFDSTSYTTAHGSTYEAFVGNSKTIGKFAILKNCANLVTTKLPNPIPNGTITASCSAVSGIAYDGRNRQQNVDVYLYFGGRPGIGEKIGPIKASGNGNSFSYTIPEKYLTSKEEVPVYGVLLTLPGWTEPTVPLSGSAFIPSGCKATPAKPVVTCTSLARQVISRNVVALTADTQIQGSATISGYSFVVKDSSGSIVSEYNISSNKSHATTSNINLKKPGSYAASVVVHSSVGDVSSVNCELSLTISAPDKCIYNNVLLSTDLSCKPCPDTPTLWVNDNSCRPIFTQSKHATNLTKNVDAITTPAGSGDRIEYQLVIENTGLTPISPSFNEELSDVLEYATIQDAGNGTYDQNTKILSWASSTIAPGAKESRTFVVAIKNPIPASPRGISEPGSYDCIITNTFGNSTQVRVNCPAIKGIETAVSEIPKTGPTENILFAGLLLSVVTYFYARSHQINREIRTIRNEFNSTGVI